MLNGDGGLNQRNVLSLWKAVELWIIQSFFIENDGVESSCVINDGDTFQIVLGHEKNHHHLLSVVNLDGKYEVAVFKINTNGKISNKSWANPIVQKTFTDFDECRKFYKSCAENY